MARLILLLPVWAAMLLFPVACRRSHLEDTFELAVVENLRLCHLNYNKNLFCIRFVISVKFCQFPKNPYIFDVMPNNFRCTLPRWASNNKVQFVE